MAGVVGSNPTRPTSYSEWLFSFLCLEGFVHYASRFELSTVYILLFNTLTGLRPDEACKAVQIIRKEENNYVRKDLMILEHYKFPDIFIRRTKKAYISIVTDQILELAKQASNCGYNALRLAVKRKDLDMNMAYCRKIFATPNGTVLDDVGGHISSTGNIISGGAQNDHR